MHNNNYSFHKIIFEVIRGRCEKITQTAVDWIFNEDKVVNMSESLSRGFFRGGNQLGNLLVMLLPIMLYITVKKTNIINCVTVFLQIMASILIGTRISSFLWIPIIIFTVFAIIFFSIIKKEIKISKWIWVFLILTIVPNTFLLSKSPTLSRKTDYSDSLAEIQVANNTQENLKNFNKKINSLDNDKKEENNKNTENEVREEKEKFIENNYVQFDIQKVFLYDIYNYKYDAEFWINIMNSPYEVYNNSRKLQFLIADRIFELNNNILDKFVGIGFTTTRNGSLYTELDYYAHYYTIGILGSALFLYSELAILLFCIIKIILNMKEKLNYENTVYILSLILIFVIALISAHVLDELVVTIFIGFILGQLLCNTLKKEKEEV